jgi:light-harvesting complex 1 beta chain
MSDRSDYIDKVNPSGVSDDEAKEFHGIFTTSAVVFVGIAVVAHVLVWAWRPWLLSTSSSTASALDSVQQLVNQLV